MKTEVELLPPSVRAKLREGSYTTTQNGQPVTISVTDGDTLKDAADLWAIIQGEYKGTKSAASEGIKAIVGVLQSGAPLSDVQWATFHRLKNKYAQQLADFRAGPDNDIEGFVPLPPTGVGRIQEAAFALDGQIRRLMEQYNTPSTTAKDKAITAPHLLDSVLHDLAHTRQHIERIMAPDVKGDPQSVAFNAEHALNHAESASEHASKLDQHLGQNKTNPKTWTAERAALNEMREAIAWLREFSADEPRDEKGEWSGGGGGADPLTGPRWVPNGTRIQMPGQLFGSKVVGRSADGYLVRHEPGLPGTGLLSRVRDESAVVVHGAALDSGYRPGREAAQPREDSGKYMGGARSYDPLLLGADDSHAAEAAQRLVDEGRIRVAGQGEAAQTAAADLARRVGDRASVKTMAVQGNPYTQLKATKEATSWPERLRVFHEAAKAKTETETVAADPEHPLPSKPTIAVDFDGVIHMGGHGMPGEVEGQPMDGAQDGLKQLAQRYRVVVLTARQDFAAVRRWLTANGMGEYVDAVTNIKPNALAYIDDRAIHFAGDWKAVIAAADPAKATDQPIQVKRTYEAANDLARYGDGLLRMREYSDAEPRDDHGRWSGGGGGSEPPGGTVPSSLHVDPNAASLFGGTVADAVGRYGLIGAATIDPNEFGSGGAPAPDRTGVAAGKDSSGSDLRVGDSVTHVGTGLTGRITSPPDSVFGRVQFEGGSHTIGVFPSELSKTREALLPPSLRRALESV